MDALNKELEATATLAVAIAKRYDEAIPAVEEVLGLITALQIAMKKLDTVRDQARHVRMEAAMIALVRGSVRG